MRNVNKVALAAAVAMVAVQASAASYTYSPANLALSTNAWNDAATWADVSFPNSPGDIADLSTVAITGKHTLTLNQAITVGQISIGDTDGVSAYEVAAGTGGSLTFKSALPGGTAVINTPSTGTVANTFSAPVFLDETGYATTLNWNPGTQGITTTGAFTTNGNNVIITGGRNQAAAWAVSGALNGGGTITNSSLGGINVSGTKAFTGTFILNSGIGGSSNSLSLTATSGSVKDAAEIILNAYVEQGFGLRVVGGGYHQGANSTVTDNPGQRITTNTVTFNGGQLNMNGLNATVGTANPWQQGLEYISDTTATVNFNRGYALLGTGAGTNNKGTRWNITQVNRNQGATAYLRSSTLSVNARVIADNGTSLGIGGTGGPGTPNMKVVPWLLAANTNGSAQNGGLATYDTTISGDHVVGFRALDTTSEMSSAITAGADANVNTSNFGSMGAGVTAINSLRHGGASVSSIAAGKTLAIGSGAVLLTLNGGGLGAPGVGTVDFGSAEAVIWSLGTSSSTTPAVNTNYIGSSITGSGGLTKAGTGILVLRGPNTYTGKTFVAGGTLQVGDGTNSSILGDDDVTVAAGAMLKLLNAGVIDDSASLILEQYGLASSLGRIDIAAGIVEDLSGLVLGDMSQPAGYYGSTAAAAAYDGVYTVTANDTYFAGTGLVQVVPEPSMLTAFASLAAGSLIRRRRRA